MEAQQANRPGSVPDRTSLAVLAAGLVSIALLVATDWLGQAGGLDDAERLRTLGEVEARLATARLRLDEAERGIPIDRRQVRLDLEHAFDRVRAMSGDEARGSGLRAPLDELQASIRAFRELVEGRLEDLESGSAVRIGAELDPELQGLDAELRARIRTLEAALEARSARRQLSSRRFFWILLAAWTGAVAVLSRAFLQRERLRRRDQAARLQNRDQLIQAQRLEAMGELAGGLAHDINNYLAAIRGHCEIVRMKPQAEQRVVRKMDSAIRTVHKASALLDRLLAFSRQQPVRPEVIDLNRVVEGMETVIRPSLGGDVQVDNRLAPDLWNVRVDLIQIEQVLVNLLVNARDAMAGTGEITIETANQTLIDDSLAGDSLAGDLQAGDSFTGEETGDGASEWVILTVTDTGRGIPEADRDKIFEPFWTTKAPGIGGGLGLATAYGIVRQSGGEIEVDSEVGVGTTFTLRLPRSRQEVSAIQQPLSSVVTLGGDERILLVDDNRDFRDSVRALLEVLGYQVTAAADGEEALEIFTRSGGAFDLVLSDVMMPRMGGRDLGERLAEHSDVPVIFMSGRSSKSADSEADQPQPETIHFSKNRFSASRLAKLIREALDGSRAG